MNRLAWNIIVATLLVFALCPRVGLAQGKFPITEKGIVSARFEHYYPLPDKKFHAPDFEWKFNKDTFAIKKGKAAIPSEVLELLGIEDKSAAEITGNWTLADGLPLLTDVHAGGSQGKKEVRLSAFMTAPTVLRISVNGAQYVFAVDD